MLNSLAGGTTQAMSVFKRLYDILRAEWQPRSPLQTKATAFEDTSGSHNYSDDFQPASDQPPESSSYSERELEYFANLELVPGASFTEIKSSYRRLLAKYHPDRYHEDKRRPFAEEITRRLNEAYQYFEQKEKRKT